MAPQLRWSQIKLEREVVIGSIPLQDMNAPPPAFSEVVNEQTPFPSTCPTAPPHELAPPPYSERELIQSNEIYDCVFCWKIYVYWSIYQKCISYLYLYLFI